MAGGPLHGNVRFFTMGDAGYFLGAVALVNSLRIVGHHEPITFLDLGVTPDQREMLATECDIVDVAPGPRDHPFTYQPYPYLLDPDGICVIVDSDVIITQRLDALIDAAAQGKIAAFPDLGERRFPEWESIFHLHSPLQTGITYVNSGLVAFDASRHRDFLARWWHLCRDLDVDPAAMRGNPTAFADQDALNALLMSDYATDQMMLTSPGMVLGARSLSAARVDDLTRLTCSREGEPVAALHSVSPPKPWSDDARFMLHRNPYVTCLRRCLSGTGLTIRLPDSGLPGWLRSGRRAAVESWLLQCIYPVRRLAYNARGRLGDAFSRRRDLRSTTEREAHAPNDDLEEFEAAGAPARGTG